ncbi:MAG TPA: cytochrome P460 family protein [Labilithrix sp.]|nr:cytochrome P460 family protein [Labilithrix sp.]
MLVIACAASGGGGGAVGASDKRAAGSSARAASDGGLVDGAGSLPANYRTTFTKLNNARFVSQGHAAGRWDVEVWANEPAQKALSSRSREVPVGAIVVQEHYERAPAAEASGSTGPVMIMEKKPAGFSKEHGDWRFAVIGSQGQLVHDGVIETCAGCHDDAPMDGLFPVVD